MFVNFTNDTDESSEEDNRGKIQPKSFSEVKDSGKKKSSLKESGTDRCGAYACYIMYVCRVVH